MLVWKDEYSVGIKSIDEQHKYLFEIGNNAYKLLKDNSIRDNSIIDKYADIALIMDDLRRYTMFHFKTEEDYMLKINHREYLSQKKEHDEFIARLNEMKPEEIKEKPEKYIEDILAFIFNWLLSHILRKDKLIKVDKLD